MGQEPRKYRLTKQFWIMHSPDGTEGRMHAHTVTASCTVVKLDGGIMMHGEAEDAFAACLAGYDGKCLNGMPELGGDVTIERLGEAICEELDGALHAIGYDMCRLEIGEMPTRTYIITDELRD